VAKKVRGVEMKFKLVLFSLVVLLISCGNQDSEKNPDNDLNQSNAKDNKLIVPVEVMIVTSKTVEQKIPLTGVLQPLHSVDIISEVSGKVQKTIKKLGDKVTTDDVLALIDDKIPLSQFLQAEAQVLYAENDYNIAQLNLKGDEELLANGDISRLEYEQSLLRLKSAKANYLSAKAQLSLMEKGYLDTKIKSPINGYISRKHIDIGTMVSPGIPLYRVVDLATLKIEIGIAQDLIKRISTGSKADLTISALNGHSFEGSVRYISPQADENTGTFKVEIHVKNTKDSKIFAGMTAKVDYALVTTNGSNHVYKVEKDTARLIDISIDETIGSEVVVGEGLVEGDTIVVVGMKNLGKETRVFIEAVN
jgi:membrane fusion protein (multidrug efflux system)